MIHSDINLRKYSTRYICGLQRLYQISQSWETVIYFLAVRVLIFRLFHLPLLVGSTFGKMVGNSYTLIRTSWASAEDKRWRPFWMLGPAQKCGWGEEKGRRGGAGRELGFRRCVVGCCTAASIGRNSLWVFWSGDSVTFAVLVQWHRNLPG